ncbi:MAG: sigma-70 family RNA polymerase sigma factor [Pirellula sp.]|jgi:RNA polymerase sigma-70 factor (ECF subfamily)
MNPTMDEKKDIDNNEDKAAHNAFYEAFSHARSKLERIVEFRMHPSIRSRLDPGDVLQEAYLRMSNRVEETALEMGVTLFVWMRQKTIQTLVDLQRSHFREKRDVMKESRDLDFENGQTSSLSIARYLIDDITSPSLAAARSEDLDQLHQALDSMNEIDREVLAMRHFEQLSNTEVAEALGLTTTAASNRYIRAVTRLGEILKALAAKPI